MIQDLDDYGFQELVVKNAKSWERIALVVINKTTTIATKVSHAISLMPEVLLIK